MQPQRVLGREIEENVVINDLVQIGFRRALFDFPSSFVLSIKLAVNYFLIYPRSCDCNYRWTAKSSDAQCSEKCSNPFLRPYPHTILYHITDFDLAVNISQSFNWEDFLNTLEEIDYDSLEPPKSLLKWYHYLSDEYKDNGRFWGSKLGCNESDVKPSWKDIKKAKACMLAKTQASEASSKAKVEVCGSKVKVEVCGSKAKLQASTKTLIVKSPGRGTLEVESDVNLIYDVMYIEIIEISSDSSKDRKRASKETAPIFYGPLTQGLLDAYGYNTIKEYLLWNYFPSIDNENTDMETTDKRNTDKDCIVDSNSAMSKGKYVPVCKKYKPNMYCPVPVTGCVLGLENVTTWDEIEKKMGARK
ncbi:hypothetical protein Tco_1448054 [Tanacetum coccineum]